MNRTTMIITKSELSEFIKVRLFLVYKLPSFWGFFSLLILLSAIGNAVIDHKYGVSALLVALVLLIPLSIVQQSRKIYKTAPMAGTKVVFEFDETSITMKGESFNSNYSWDNIYRIVKYSKWLLIYYNELQYTYIPRKDISDEQLEAIKVIARKYPQIRKNF